MLRRRLAHTSAVEEQPDNLSIPALEWRSGRLVAMKRVARHSAVDVVRNQLVELIERGDIPVGDWLPSEAEMSGYARAIEIWASNGIASRRRR